MTSPLVVLIFLPRAWHRPQRLVRAISSSLGGDLPDMIWLRAPVINTIAQKEDETNAMLAYTELCPSGNNTNPDLVFIK